MAEKGQFFFSDLFSCQNSGQHEIQNGDPMMQSAAGHPQKRNAVDIGRHEHGPRKGRRAVMNFPGAGQANGFPGHVIRIHTHTAAQQQQVAAAVDMLADGCGDHALHRRV